MATSESVMYGNDGSADHPVKVDGGGYLIPADSAFRIRGSMKTGYVALTNGTEQSLLAGTSNKFHDLLQISFCNTSDQIIDVTLKDDGTTVQTYVLAANTSYNFNFQKPIPCNAAGYAWTIDAADANNSTVYCQALFIEY